jgi:hypothetical protein
MSFDVDATSAAARVADANATIESVFMRGIIERLLCVLGWTSIESRAGEIERGPGKFAPIVDAVRKDA